MQGAHSGPAHSAARPGGQKTACRALHPLLEADAADEAAVRADPHRAVSAAAPELAHQQPVQERLAPRQDNTVEGLAKACEELSGAEGQVQHPAATVDSPAQRADKFGPAQIVSVADV